MTRRVLAGLTLALAALGFWLALGRGGRAPELSAQPAGQPVAEVAAADLAADAAPVTAVAADGESLPREAEHRAIDADELPWAGDHAVNPRPHAELEQVLADATRDGDLAELRNRLNSLATRQECREAFRRLARGDDSSLAAALALLWLLPAGDPLHEDGLRALAGMDHPGLAAWLARVLPAARDEESRARLGEILAVMQGPATVGAIADVLRALDDPAQRAPWLALLRRRSSVEELPALARLTESAKRDIAAAAAFGMAGVGGWEACLWLAEMAGAADAPGFYAEALAASLSAFSREALRALAAESGVPGAARGAAMTALAATESSVTPNQWPHMPVGTGPEVVRPDTDEVAAGGSDDDERWF